MKRFFPVAVLLAAFLFSGHSVYAQTSEEIRALQDDVKSLKEGQAAMSKELQEIKTMLRARPAQPPTPQVFKEAVINIEGNPKKGDKNAKLVLMEFSDYQ